MNNISKLALAASTAIFAPLASAATLTNNMTNIVTIVDACDMIAIGVDFGIQPGTITDPITSMNANTMVGNQVTGNVDHPNAMADGMDGTEGDELTLVTPIALVNTVASAAIGALAAAAPGVYVACTAEPESLVVDGVNTDAVLDLAAPAGMVDTFDSEMIAVGNGAVGSVNYTLSFTGVAVSAPSLGGLTPTIFIATYAAMGTIPADTNPGSIASGFYADVAVATLTF